MAALLFRFGMAVCALTCVACAHAQQPRTEAPEAQIREDLDRSAVVDEDDLAAFLVLYGADNMLADLNGDGVLDHADIVQMVGAVTTNKRERFHLPDVPGHDVLSLTREYGVVIVLLREQGSGRLVYMPFPFSGKSGIAGPRAVTLPWLTSGEAQLVFDDAGMLRRVLMMSGEGVFDEIRKIATEAVVQMEVAEAEVNASLPPIGDCPGCVPLATPDDAGDCVYLYSKWGLAQNCLVDCFGCSGGPGEGHVVCATACCFEANPGQADCDDDYGVPHP